MIAHGEYGTARYLEELLDDVAPGPVILRLVDTKDRPRLVKIMRTPPERRQFHCPNPRCAERDRVVELSSLRAAIVERLSSGNVEGLTLGVDV